MPALQLAELAVGLPRVHGEVWNVPVPLVVKSTVPVGGLWVPVEVSVTVAVHTACDAFTGTEAGLQVTVVVVARRLTVMLAGVVLELGL